MSKALFTLLTLLGLVFLSQACTKYSYAYPGDIYSPYALPGYSIGYYPVNSTLKFNIQLKNDPSLQGAAFSIDPSTTLIQLKDANNNAVINTFDYNEANGQYCDHSVSGTNCTLTYNITTSGNYYLDIQLISDQVNYPYGP